MGDTCPSTAKQSVTRDPLLAVELSIGDETIEMTDESGTILAGSGTESTLSLLSDIEPSERDCTVTMPMLNMESRVRILQWLLKWRNRGMNEWRNVSRGMSGGMGDRVKLAMDT